jgi:superfamily I DNA/RNA helicase
VDIRGRSQTLRVNYRTSHQIRRSADRLLQPELADVDGNAEIRNKTISALSGPEPTIVIAETPDIEIRTVADWIKQRIAEGLSAGEIAVIVRSDAELTRANSAVSRAGLRASTLDAERESRPGDVSLCTMHIAKGLEFRAVVVMACDDDVVPLQSRMQSASDESELAEVHNTERQLLYVACTRARDQLLVTGVEPGSEFLADIRG